MLLKLKALVYWLAHPFETIELTVVRRYVDAQKHFIGELYLGEGRTAQMVGMSCDNLPLDIKPNQPTRLCVYKDFTAPMPPNTIRVGGTEPANHEEAKRFVGVRQLCTARIVILNRFIEHVMEAKHG